MSYEVRFVSKEIEEEYDRLKETDESLYKVITRAIEKLKLNRRAGQKIPVDQVSKKYIQLYGTRHFWKLKLSREWRLIYTVAGNQVRIITVILSWFKDHKQYRKEVYK
jgi:Txe/YoeB family toxin of Txe-Axe toxin-antitoxin module